MRLSNYFAQEVIDSTFIVMIFIIAILLVLVIWQVVKTSTINKNYCKLMRGMDDNNLQEIILNYVNKTDVLQKELITTNAEIKNIAGIIKLKGANINMKRYNAYEDTGNDLSFTIAVLNDLQDGFVLSSLYSRNDQRVYAKPIENGQSKYTLSDEEKEVVKNLGNVK